MEGGWNDFNGVFLKEKNNLNKFPTRIIDQIDDFYNGIKNDDFKNIINHQEKTEDQNNFGYKFWYKSNKKLQKYFKKFRKK